MSTEQFPGLLSMTDMGDSSPPHKQLVSHSSQRPPGKSRVQATHRQVAQPESPAQQLPDLVRPVLASWLLLPG